MSSQAHRPILCLLGAAILSSASAMAAAWPTPMAIGSTDTTTNAGNDVISGAVLYPFHPSSEEHTRGAVLIVPDTDGEEIELARWFNQRGLAAFVFRPRPGAADRSRDAADLIRGVRLLRVRAPDLGISPQRIGVLGLSRGAELVASVAYRGADEGRADAADPVERVSGRPDLVALIWGGSAPAAVPATSPATFLIGSTDPTDQPSGAIKLWDELRSARVAVDAHFFSRGNIPPDLAAASPSPASWPGMFYAWARFQGLLTDEPRLPLKGLVFLDGRILPHGYVVLTPLDFVGTGPVIGRVINSTANVPLGEFAIAAAQGPIAGRYRVEVRQNMGRWLSNSFSGDLVRARNGVVTPEQAYFGHHRHLGPTLEDQRVFTKVRPSDDQDYIIELKPGADANLEMKIEVFSQ